ncbi:predicted protein [Nematostella vectensis]|uniref:Uncharacterized protein n=1 Tax=Nematostella vectensis TaxID=45351 RepID=A7RQC4_NEMVE|nr:predicted protein [Nematostella vectensis]|eukprot:XP_001638330.1 predicted protein [Nematostella vectensis]
MKQVVVWSQLAKSSLPRNTANGGHMSLKRNPRNQGNLRNPRNQGNLRNPRNQGNLKNPRKENGERINKGVTRTITMNINNFKVLICSTSIHSCNLGQYFHLFTSQHF